MRFFKKIAIKDPQNMEAVPPDPLPSSLPPPGVQNVLLSMHVTLLQRMWYSITVAICGGIASIFQ